MAALRRAVVRGFRGAPARAAVGVLERLAGAPRGGYGVLTYHRVDHPDARPWLYPALLSASPSGFERQLRDIAARYQPIGLPELLAAYRENQALPRRAVLVTFDDAYRDFAETAWPVLRALGIPVVLFVPTAYPDSGQAFWWDRLWDAVRNTREKALDTSAGRLELADDRARLRTARVLIDVHKQMPHDDAMASVDHLMDRLGQARTARSDVLGWEELRALSAEGVQIATHSRTHPLLTRVDADRLVEEIAGARRDLDRELPGTSFGTVLAYPSGEHDAATRSKVADLGIELAFSTDRGVNRIGRDDPFALRRVNVGARSGPEILRAQLAFYTLPYPAGGA